MGEERRCRDDLGEDRRCGPPRADPVNRCSSARSRALPARPLPCLAATALSGPAVAVRPPPCLAAGALPGMLGGGRRGWAHRNRSGSDGDGGEREEWGLGETGRGSEIGLGFHRAFLADHRDEAPLPQRTRAHKHLVPMVIHTAATERSDKSFHRI